eukprot:SAG31_NODE_4133_length_3551_cov_2.629200_3_plen_39_part_00
MNVSLIFSYNIGIMDDVPVVGWRPKETSKIFFFLKKQQ